MHPAANAYPQGGPRRSVKRRLEVDNHLAPRQRKRPSLPPMQQRPPSRRPEPFTVSCRERGGCFAFDLLLPIPAFTGEGGPLACATSRPLRVHGLGLPGGGRLPTAHSELFQEAETQALATHTTTVSAWSARTSVRGGLRLALEPRPKYRYRWVGIDDMGPIK